MSLCLLEKDYSSKRMEMLQFSKKLPKSPVLQSPEVRQMVINSKPLITKHWTAT